MGAFRTTRYAGLAKLAAAAKEPGEIHVYTAENRTLVARRVDPKDLLANANAGIQAANPEAFRQWQASQPQGSAVLRTEIWVEVPDQHYIPATVPEAGGISVAEVRTVPGKGATYDSVRRDLVKFRQKIGYPYPVYAFRVVLGEPRMVYVTGYDSRDKFFGANTLAALVEKAGAGAEWQALGGRLLASMDREWKTTLWAYARDLSYLPKP
jgi:hypothetical protein